DTRVVRLVEDHHAGRERSENLRPDPPEEEILRVALRVGILQPVRPLLQLKTKPEIDRIVDLDDHLSVGCGRGDQQQQETDSGQSQEAPREPSKHRLLLLACETASRKRSSLGAEL